jgi:FkbM family methyltransferase
MKMPEFIGNLPVVILRGPARGSWWTLYPWTSYWRLGGHEPRVDAALQAVGDLRGKSVWDCGAHFGIYTVRFARQVGETGQVAAFEPDPVSFAKTQRHVRMNRFKNVVAFNAAASDSAEDAVIVVQQGLGGTTSHLPYPGEVLSPESRTVTVHRVRGDDLVSAGKVRRPDLIKLDVEGHGGEVLVGAGECLRISKPAIIAAMHSPQEVEAIRVVVEPLGYRLWDYRQPTAKEIGWNDCGLGGPYLLGARDARL